MIQLNKKFSLIGAFRDRGAWQLRACFLVACCVLLFAFAIRAETISETTPVPAVGAEGGPSRVLTPAEEEQWKRGRLVFDKDWKTAEGLGRPDMNADSCRACHLRPIIGGAGGLDVNVLRFARDNNGFGPYIDLPGGQIVSRVRNPKVNGREEQHEDTDIFEQRQAPSVLGLGLIETISMSTILANEDPLDMDSNGIAGVARIIDVAGTPEIGRFGWKAQVPTLEDFLRDAMGEEIGITTIDNGRGIGIATDADGIADPEMSAGDFDDALFYMALLAAPPRGGSTDPAIATGEQVFDNIGCDSCHIPTLMGSGGPVHLYSDILLHNVHPVDFRGMSEPGAEVGMYRTPPLWGISKTAPYMHDGSANTLIDAIRAHYGEAQQSKQFFNSLSAAQRNALILFLEDL